MWYIESEADFYASTTNRVQRYTVKICKVCANSCTVRHNLKSYVLVSRPICLQELHNGNYICIEGVSLLTADIDGSEKAKVGADAGYPLLHQLCLFDLLKSFLYCL